MDLDRGAGIQRPPYDAARGLMAIRGNPGGHLPCSGPLEHRGLHGLHAALESAANKDRANQSPVMLIHVAGQSRHTLLIGDGRIAEVDARPACRNGVTGVIEGKFRLAAIDHLSNGYDGLQVSVALPVLLSNVVTSLLAREVIYRAEPGKFKA